MSDYDYTATYSPDDNKLRLYAATRLPADLYARVKDAGFKWAPKQELFVAPMWTPERDDLLIELCGEIGDEDKSLTERAEERAERFEDYQGKRAGDAERAHAAVAAIADNIPFGQPILVGHHSERHARRDAKRIEDGMRKAVRMWDTARYWQQRAQGAIRAAKYKERDDVRYRRIKSIEADKRKQERARDEAAFYLKLWTRDALTLEQARQIADRCWLTVLRNDGGGWTAFDVLRPDGERYTACPAWTVEQVVDVARRVYPSAMARCERWMAHYDNRLAYERAMLGESGGLVADQFDIAVGGRVRIGAEWLLVLRVNRKGGRLVSVTTNARYVPVRGVEEIKDYREPVAEEVAKLKKATKLAPLCNFPGEGFRAMTRAELEKRYHFIRTVSATAQTGAYRTQMVLKGGGGLDCHNAVGVYLTDTKRKDPPVPELDDGPVQLDRIPADVTPREPLPAPEPSKFDALREQLREGVQAVVAPQLFPTPVELAERMVEIARPGIGARVLEPSAGTANLLRALPGVVPFAGLKQTAVSVVAVEHHAGLARALEQSGLANTVVCADFLQCTPDALGLFDVVLMNPPFENGADIQHIWHAMRFLKPGGRLVAICAAGPRQHEQLKPLMDTWEDLPDGTFAASGTQVRTALVTYVNAGSQPQVMTATETVSV